MYKVINEQIDLSNDILKRFRKSYNTLLTIIRHHISFEDGLGGFSVKRISSNQLLIADLNSMNAILTEIIKLLETYMKGHSEGEFIEKEMIESSLSSYIEQMDAATKALRATFQNFDGVSVEERNKALEVLYAAASSTALLGNIAKVSCENDFPGYPGEVFKELVNDMAERPLYQFAHPADSTTIVNR